MEKVGYSCIYNNTTNEIQRQKYLDIDHPMRVVDPAKPAGRVGTAFAVGPIGPDFTVIERWRVIKPGKRYAQGTETASLIEGGTKLLIDPNWMATGVTVVQARQERIAQVRMEADELIDARYTVRRQINSIVKGLGPASPIFTDIALIEDAFDVMKADIQSQATVADVDAWVQPAWPTGWEMP
ncbi:MAG: hypothetical protein GY941_20165 [Planctomycetes bacterium]|nr:hypothetical protein [Planctomycetota bacterium]